jgi:hypothetical protein
MQERIATVHPRDTWREISFGSSKGESSMSFYISKPQTLKAPKAPKVWPTISPSEIRTIIFERDTWHQIKPSRRFSHRDCKKQGLAPSYFRTPKAFLRINAGSQHVVMWKIKLSCTRGAKGVKFSHREDHRDL